MFANRLLKNVRHYVKWARKRDISCYRLYDRDLPEFPFVIDRYESCIHLQEFETPYVMTVEQHDCWLLQVRQIVAETTQLDEGAIFCKWRPKHRHRVESLLPSSGSRFKVNEQGRKFWVDLLSHQDTGLFIDHRNARSMIAGLAPGKRFLNLFSYTASFTVYAALAGAISSLSVDLSRTYLDWARDNLILNGIDPGSHQLLQADVLSWIPDAVQAHRHFDLIVLDPPSFSNSKRMESVLDTQLHHVDLILGCLDLLAPAGTLFFSTNLRRFKLDEERLSGQASFEETTGRTQPDDCRKRVHRSWLIGHKKPF
ncbi:MAG: class I SAM-dependent methyltransferase [Proteobacteria bacterium]|nr:class I SAM-dependent methyltransferase [Pseudomonadota bacterium]